MVSDSDLVKDISEREKLKPADSPQKGEEGEQEEKKEEEDQDDGVQYERKVGMKGNKLSGG